MPERDTEVPLRSACPDCGTERPAQLLACPQCGKLTHADALKQLADEAGQAEREGRVLAALQSWRSALDLLPEDSRQYKIVLDRVTNLSLEVDRAGPGTHEAPAETAASGQSHEWSKRASTGAAGAGALALGLWKFKFLGLMFLSKAKFLLLGLTKMGTLWSMLLSFGAYFTVFGWRFALGLIVILYFHEMGHLAMMVRYGLKADAPMFVPGYGAYVRTKQWRQLVHDPALDARIALAGPFWGLCASLLFYAIFLAGRWEWCAAVAGIGAALNLLNMLPFPPLDGFRAFRAIARSQRWLAAALLAALWAYAGVPQDHLTSWLLVGAMVLAAFSALAMPAPKVSGRWVLASYMLIAAALVAASLVPVKIPLG